MSEYLRDGAPNDGKGVYILGDAMQRVVLDSDFTGIDQHIENGNCLTYCLEYSASLGKHAVTQYLLAKNVPVTRQALINAASRRGPGLDLLFGALPERDRAAAKSAGMSFRLGVGDFERAFNMLDAGVEPDRYFISGAHSGALKKDDWTVAFQEALDRVLPRISRNTLAESHLELLVEGGRPVHIERTLEKLGEPVRVLMPRIFALGSQTAPDRLRAFGAIVDDMAIAYCANNMDWVAKSNPSAYAMRLCNFAFADGFEGCIRAESIRPVLEEIMLHKSGFLRIAREAAPAEYARLGAALSVIVPCLIPDERTHLIDMIRTWSDRQAGGIAFTEEAFNDIGKIIDGLCVSTMNLSPEAPSR